MPELSTPDEHQRGFVTASDLSVAYGERVALDRANFRVPTGSMVGVVGPNGGGKSTLMKAMVGLLTPFEGTVDFNGLPLAKVRRHIAYMPQRSLIDWDFPINVEQTALLGVYPRLRLLQRPSKADRRWARECLAAVEMDDLGSRQIGELSGGQQQRVFVARALVQEAEYLLLDEPFAGIDMMSEEIILSVLERLRSAGKTIFVVHHNLMTIEEHFDYTVMVDETVTSFGRTADFNLESMLLSAFRAKRTAGAASAGGAR